MSENNKNKEKAIHKKNSVISVTSRSRKPIIIAFAASFLLLGIFLSFGLLSPKAAIANNVYIKNIAVGGMTEEEAKNAIHGADYLTNINLTIKNGENTTQISATDISLEIDTDKTVSMAFTIGKSGNIFKDALAQIQLLFSKKELGCVPVLNAEALNNQLYAFGASINGEMLDHQFMVNEDNVTITPGTSGQSPDTSDAYNQIIAAITDGKYEQPIEVDLKSVKPEALSVDSAYDRIFSEPQDARYEYSAKEVTVIDHIPGVTTDKAALESYVNEVNNGQTAIVPITLSMPAITSDVLKTKLFNSTIASYSTKFSTSAANRASNVALAASKVNDTVLAPGAVFSYTDVLGNPSLDNGFKVAPIYENGKTSQGVGGGVCQVSSTLYSTVLYADLEVVKRQNHSLTVAYLPKGQDATFAYGAVDFQFKNNMDYPVKVAASANGGTLTISIIGTKRDVDRTVQLTHNLVSTTQPTVIKVANPSVPAGRVIETGKAGYVIDTTKTVYENGKVVSSKVITRSTYKMVPTEVSSGSSVPTSADVYTVPSASPTQSPIPATPAPARTQTPQTQTPQTQTPATQAPVTPAPAAQTPTESPAMPTANSPIETAVAD